MKMSTKIDSKMVAICGMNCMMYYKHLVTKKYAKQCNGCKYKDETLLEHCRKCKIKDCAKSKSLKYCHECIEYPCKWIKNLDKSYQQRHKSSLIVNGCYKKENNMEKFLKKEKMNGLAQIVME